jgi:cadmium resistance protein CadD (predicted permease)
MNLGVVGKAIAMFAVTNIDDIVVLTAFFGRVHGRAAAWRVVAGQQLGFRRHPGGLCRRR